MYEKLKKIPTLFFNHFLLNSNNPGIIIILRDFKDKLVVRSAFKKKKRKQILKRSQTRHLHESFGLIEKHGTSILFTSYSFISSKIHHKLKKCHVLMGNTLASNMVLVS